MTRFEKGVWGIRWQGKYVVSGFSRTVLILLLTSSPAWAQARLSDSLRKHVASKSTDTVDVIVHGSHSHHRHRLCSG